MVERKENHLCMSSARIIATAGSIDRILELGIECEPYVRDGGTYQTIRNRERPTTTTLDFSPKGVLGALSSNCRGKYESCQSEGISNEIAPEVSRSKIKWE